MNKMKRVLVVLLALALLLPAAAQALTGGLAVNQSAVNQLSNAIVAGTQTGTDVVVLIDRSGTMPGNDPNNIALSATKKLAEQLVVNTGTSSINMAVIAFGYGTVAATPGFMEISDDTELDKLFAVVDSVKDPASNEDTNTGLAMENAHKMIEERRKDPKYENDSFAVVLITDGHVDIGDSKGFKEEMEKQNVKSSARKSAAYTATEASKKLGADVAQKMAAEGIQLHCIGIYYNDDDLGSDMRNWVNTADGIYTQVHTRDMNRLEAELKKIIERITPQVEFDSTTIKPGNPGKFDVPVGVLQVNLQIMASDASKKNANQLISDPALFDIRFTDRKGNTGSYPLNAGNVQVNANPTIGDPYTMIQMPNPVAGSYTIEIRDNQEYTFNVDIVRIRGLLMNIRELPSVENGKPVTVKMDVTTDGNFYIDQNNLPRLTIRNSAGTEVVVDEPMTYYEDTATGERYYFYDFTPTAMGEYSVSAWMEKDQVRNESNTQLLSVIAAPIRVKANLNDINFTGHAISYYDANGNVQSGYAPVKLSYADLMAYNFDNRDNRSVEGYSYELSSYNEISVVDDGTGLIITPVQVSANGPVELSIRAKYEGMESDAVVGYIIVEDAQVPVTTTDLGGRLNGRTLETLKINILEPEKEGVATVSATDTEEAFALNDVRALFVEPNEATDGETVKEYSIKAFDANNSEVAGLASLDADYAMQLKASEEGLYRIELTALNWNDDHNKQSPATVVLNLEVKDTTMTLAIMAGGALAAILLIIIIIAIVIKASKPSFGKGMLTITMTNEDESSDGYVLLKKFGKKPVKLSVLCSNAGVRMSSARKILEKIIVKPRKGETIEVSYNIKGLGKKNMIMRSMDTKTIELDKSGERYIELDYNDGKGNY